MGQRDARGTPTTLGCAWCRSSRTRSVARSATKLAKQIATTAPLGIHTSLASAHRAFSDGEKFALATLQPAFG
jgi:hypothetical protein